MGRNKDSEVGAYSGHIKDKRGQRFGKVVVVDFDHSDGVLSWWKCKCDCGNEVILNIHQLTHHYMPNCGCEPRYRNRPSRNQVKTHHMSGTRLHRIWKGIKHRCSTTKEESRDYRNYVLRGIEMCDEWKNNFEAFYEWAMANGYNDALSIDRINNDGNYEPNNCRWVDLKQQVRNRRKTVYLTYNGEKRPLTEWCEIFGLNKKTVYGRFRYYGWTNPQEILFGKGATLCQEIQ